MKKTNSIITSFLKYNREQSGEFTEPGQTNLRHLYLNRHTARIAAMKCMDGRVNLSPMTKTPVGIIQPYRDLGGIFDLGGHFGEVFSDWVSHGIAQAKCSILLVTYHWSKGDKHRGCAGFGYDTEAAKAYTRGEVRDIEKIFGKDHSVVYPIQVGIETDEDALVFHSANGKMLDLSKAGELAPEELRARIEDLYPDMNDEMLDSLLPLCLGNISHISDIRTSQRPITEIVHKENILGVGRGFDWHHQPNRMLIVGPFSFDFAKSIKTAGTILFDNIKKKRIPKEEGVVLVASAVYRDTAGSQKIRAEFKAKALARFAMDTLKREVPKLMPFLSIDAGIMDENTRLFTTVKLDNLS